MRHFRTFAFLLLCIHGNFISYGQFLDFDSLYANDSNYKVAIEQSPDFTDIFISEEVVKITIESDFKNLVKQKYKGAYQPSTLRYFVSDTVVAVRQITIKPRGNMRRQTCYFPPLMLNLPKKDAVLKQMHDFDKLKMVLDCKRGEIFDQYLLSEYYAYKLYNLITDYSFRVRLYEVTLLDVNDKFKSLKTHAYIIENIEQLADRHNAIQIETESIRDQLTDLETLGYGYLFQYLIGNTDWSIPARHNIQMIKSKDPNLYKPYVVPYDFDYSGLVNTDYAVPDERLGIESVRERVYRGVCIDNQFIEAAVERFKQSKEEVYRLYESSLLEERVKNYALNYIKEFYQIIESPTSLRRNILESCK